MKKLAFLEERPAKSYEDNLEEPKWELHKENIQASIGHNS